MEKIRDALIEDMRAEGVTIDHLFDSGAVNNAYQFFKSKADRLAIDIMARSILGRPAKPIELRQRYFVLQESYRECVQLGIIRNGLGGDPNFGATLNMSEFRRLSGILILQSLIKNHSWYFPTAKRSKSTL